MALVQQAIEVLKQAAAKADPSGDLGQAVIKSLGALAKHAPAHQAAPDVGNTALNNIAETNRRNAMLQAVQRQQAQGGGAAGGGAPPPAAAAA